MASSAPRATVQRDASRAEAPAEPLPPQTTDVDRPGLPAGHWTGSRGPGWSWGRCREGPRPGPRGVGARPPSLSLLARLPSGSCCPLLVLLRSVAPGLRGTALLLSPRRVPAAGSGRPVPGVASLTGDLPAFLLLRSLGFWAQAGRWILPAVHLCFHGKVERHPKMQFHCRQ